jgi:hypothetical protein
VNGVVDPPDALRQQIHPKAFDFVLVQVTNGVAELLRRGIGQGLETMPRQFLEDVRVVNV